MDIVEMVDILVEISLVVTSTIYHLLAKIASWLKPVLIQVGLALLILAWKLSLALIIIFLFSLRVSGLLSQLGLLWLKLKMVHFRRAIKSPQVSLLPLLSSRASALGWSVFGGKSRNLKSENNPRHPWLDQGSRQERTGESTEYIQVSKELNLVSLDSRLRGNDGVGFHQTSDDNIIKPIFASDLWLFRARPAFAKLFLAGTVVSSTLAAVIMVPGIMVQALPYQPEQVVAPTAESQLGGKFDEGTLYSTVKLPELDETLPKSNWLVIEKIGVKTPIQEGSYEEEEELLKTGSWRIPEFATPEIAEQVEDFPTIIVAHRYGYLKWSNDFRRQYSFYNLDKLQIGDTFEIWWGQRRYVYEVYAGEESKELSDYSADVVLYTCKYLNGPVRIFRYARRVDLGDKPVEISAAL